VTETPSQTTAQAQDAKLPSRSALLAVLDIAIFVAVLAIPLAWFFDPLQGSWGRVSWGAKPVLIPFGLLIVRQLIRRATGRRGLAEAGLYRKLCFAILSTFVSLWLVEAVLTKGGVKQSTAAPIVITGEEAIDTKQRSDNVISDPELLWRFAPDRDWDGYRVNRHGYRTRDFELVKPAGQRRVIALGDSCTAQGRPPYSDVLHELLQKSPPTKDPWEAFNMGVYGYSSMQGLRQYQKYGVPLKPDYVSLYYGWNDHWLYKIPDHLRMAVRMHPLKAAVTDALRRKRLYTFISGLARPEGIGNNEHGRDFRVPADMYRATLTEFIRNIRQAGAQPILIAAPRRGLTPSVVKSGHARSVEEVEKAHDEYVAITRDVALAEKVALVDLAAQLADPAYDGMFMRDGIHLEQDGLEVIAAALHAKLVELAEGKE
jgi:lysophospholipase L1-like esterase